MRGPIGGFFVWKGDTPALLLGGGSGVVPLMAMLRLARRTGRARSRAARRVGALARRAAVRGRATRARDELVYTRTTPPDSTATAGSGPTLTTEDLVAADRRRTTTALRVRLSGLRRRREPPARRPRAPVPTRSGSSASARRPERANQRRGPSESAPAERCTPVSRAGRTTSLRDDAEDCARRQEYQFFGALFAAAPGLATAWWVLLALRGLLPALIAVATGALIGAVQRRTTPSPGRSPRSASCSCCSRCSRRCTSRSAPTSAAGARRISTTG